MAKRGNADRLPVGQFAVTDPDDDDRWTYWRVEPDGTGRALRPWPADVRWAPLRPPYPEGLDVAARKEWSQEWYDDTYFPWKDAVIEAIARDPQGAADAFAEHAPDAVLPEPRKPRPRVRVRPRPISAKQRQLAAERLMAEALRRAGMTERQVAAEMGVPKTTARRRLTSGTAVADALVGVMLEAQVSALMSRFMELAASASAEDAPRLRERLEQIKRLQALAAGTPPDVSPPPGDGLGLFGPRLTGDDW